MRATSEASIEQLRGSHATALEEAKTSYEAALQDQVNTLERSITSKKVELQATQDDLAKAKAALAASLPEIEALRAQLEEAKVAATSIALDMLSYQSRDEDTRQEPDARERWALDRLCDELFERGGLVPVSAKCVPVQQIESPCLRLS